MEQGFLRATKKLLLGKCLLSRLLLAKLTPLGSLRLSRCGSLMERQVDTQIDKLKTLILTMGGYVENALDCAISALMSRQSDKFAEVHNIEKKINEDRNC